MPDTQESGPWDEFPAAGEGSLTAAEVAALAAADADPDEWDPAEAEAEDGMPAELQALSPRELAELCAASPTRPVPAARPAGPAWPLSYQAAGFPGGVPPAGALFPRDGSGDGSGFADGGELDTAPASLALAAFADDAYRDLAGLDDDSLVGVLRAYRRLTSQSQARELAVVAELARRRPEPGTPPGLPGQFPAKLSEFIAAEIAPALTLTMRAAGRELDLALDLAVRPATAAALECGRIDLPKARIIIELLGPLGLAHADAVEAQVLPRAGDMTTAELRAALLRAILAVDPDAARRRREQEEEHARVEYWADPEGTASLAGRSLPPDEVLAADQRISAIATAWKKLGAQGGMDLLRARVYLALLSGHDVTTPPPSLLPGAPSPGEPTPGEPTPGARDPVPPVTGTVNLTIPLRTLLGLADAPGEAAGYGPLHADTCRSLAEALAGQPATRWGVIVTAPGGYAMGYGGPVRARPVRPPGQPRGSPPGAGGWTITVTTEPIAPYH